MKLFIILSMMVALSSSAIAEQKAAPGLAKHCGADGPKPVNQYQPQSVTQPGQATSGTRAQ